MAQNCSGYVYRDIDQKNFEKMASTDWESLAATISQTVLLIILYLLRKYLVTLERVERQVDVDTVDRS